MHGQSKSGSKYLIVAIIVVGLVSVRLLLLPGSSQFAKQVSVSARSLPTEMALANDGMEVFTALPAFDSDSNVEADKVEPPGKVDSIGSIEPALLADLIVEQVDYLQPVEQANWLANPHFYSATSTVSNEKPDQLVIETSSLGNQFNSQPFAEEPMTDARASQTTDFEQLTRSEIPPYIAETNDSVEVQDSENVQVTGLTQPEQSGGPSKSTQGTTDYVLAEQPKLGDHYKVESPVMDRDACEIPAIVDDFSPDAIAPNLFYDPWSNQNIYQCKQLYANQRPLLELGRPWYQLGQLSPGSSLLGFNNNVNPQFLVFGDYRQAIASNTIDGDSTTQLAFELNTFWNLHITSTERLVWGVAPLDDGVTNTRHEFDNDRFDFETDFDFDFGYFEGDLGAIAGGLTGNTLPFDAPFAVGLTPVLIQNGIWLNDAVEGLFFTIPARNSPAFNISNMDITFAFIHDEISSDAFQGDKNAAKAYAIYSWIEALNGYFEIDYAFLEDRSSIDRSYHNIGVAYSRRFGRLLSHSTRVIANAGQQVSAGEQTADGVLLLSENSLITSNPYNVIPYFNMFAGFDTPQSVAGDDELLNTGILFETDGMTGFPTLDIRGQDTAGGAVGLNLLAQDFRQQLILEAAAVFRMDDSDLPGDQYGVGMRYQLPLSNSWIFRTDGMYGFFRSDEDDFGARMELRKKF